MLAGLIIPPAIVPTIYVLQSIGLFKTLIGLTLVEVAFLLPFSVLIFRTFMASIPRELDEAAIIDGATAPAVPPRDLPIVAAGGDHRDRRVGRRGLQRLREPPVLPARERERDRAADAVQLHRAR